MRHIPVGQLFISCPAQLTSSCATSLCGATVHQLPIAQLTSSCATQLTSSCATLWNNYTTNSDARVDWVANFLGRR
uniref:Uncharacterized protein n=1 Tax=uncultured Chloroflexota bacterium TaxID=166587 RepID=H5SBG8_9CHLR|nr:hypothetical protein HGMM_F07C06C26 [uncultured Chloroflexota bacterium]